MSSSLLAVDLEMPHRNSIIDKIDFLEQGQQGARCGSAVVVHAAGDEIRSSGGGYLLMGVAQPIYHGHMCSTGVCFYKASNTFVGAGSAMCVEI